MEASRAGALCALHKCLARCGTDQSSLVASVNSIAGLHKGDVLLAVGSVVEGLGNTKSDLDLLLVAGESDAGRAETEQGWALGRCLVDLRIVPAAAVEALSSRLRQWACTPWNLVELAPFSYDERLLLHRLLSGLAMYPADPASVGHSWRPDKRELVRLKLQVARHMARTIQVDMVGYRDELDHASLVFAAQDLLGHSVDGLLAGHNFTNPNPKWRSSLLKHLPRDWDQPLILRPTASRADRAVWDLHRAPEAPERDPAVSHTLRCVTFARAVFAWAEASLVHGGTRLPAGDWTRQESRWAQTLPSLELDVDFVFSEHGINIARLNEFGPSLRLSVHEFAALLLFDGQTSVLQAESVVNSALADGLKPVDVSGTVEVATRNGLCFEPHQPRTATDV